MSLGNAGIRKGSALLFLPVHHLTEQPAFIAEGLKRHASDWHLTEGGGAYARVHGEMQPLDYQLTKETAFALIGREVSPDDMAKHVDSSFSAGGEFFRANTFLCRGRICMAIRHLERKARSLKEMGVPVKFTELLDRRSGLVLVTGPTGSGKSTTLTAAIDHLNHAKTGVLIALEDPIEYLHENKNCVIRQREYRKDFQCFPEAISAALRQDPDYLVVSEMRDYRTITSALTLAETGHLVIATLHSATAADAVTRILDAVPDSDKAQQRSILAKALLGVLAQQLLPTMEGRRTGCFELMVNTSGISSLIREGRFGNITSDISTGSRDGMVSMDQALEYLVRIGRIARGVAVANATNPKFLHDNLARITGRRT